MSLRSTVGVLVLVISALALSSCAARSAVGTADGSADRITGHARAGITAFTKAFYVESKGYGRFLRSTAGGNSVFRTEAEMIEASEDVYQSSGSPADKHLVTALVN
jgi:hypothetical protein